MNATTITVGLTIPFSGYRVRTPQGAAHADTQDYAEAERTARSLGTGATVVTVDPNGEVITVAGTSEPWVFYTA